MLQRHPSLPPEQRDHLGTIKRSGEHLLALINDVLQLSRIEAGRVTLEPATFELHAFFDDLASMIRVRAEAKALQFRMTGVDTAPRFVTTDENKLRQVLANLLDNAVKFTKRGAIALSVAAVNAGPQPDNGRDVLRFAIHDTGAARVPIVALTAHALEEERQKILAAGCTAVVRKPFREQEIFAMMEHHLDLTYIYEKEPPPEQAAPTEVQISPDRLAALPVDFHQQLHEAALRLDTQRTQTLIEQIAEHDAQTAAALQSLADRLQYHRLLACLEMECE